MRETKKSDKIDIIQSVTSISEMRYEKVILRLKKKNSEKANNVKNNCSFRSDC
jgi:hypothetical protein